ncbi:S-adenosylmethionine decarboxylase proenzyme [candidate division KSB1 bacterium]|nr:S-adenosylmethionine decarboxylase proenzyme [candidate division KSB1 bacterium]RQW05655.1 MAG: S-adenosylmethionine decarboxylase proenzyme [candidate division KSB1 bacterium]
MNGLGRHILVEFLRCDPAVLNDVPHIKSSMVQAAEHAGATVISSNFHYFSPHGVSGVIIIEESHLAIHTWPEYKYAAVDLFTCGDDIDPWVAFNHIQEALSSKNYTVIELHRGFVDEKMRDDLS